MRARVWHHQTCWIDGGRWSPSWQIAGPASPFSVSDVEFPTPAGLAVEFMVIVLYLEKASGRRLYPG